MHKLATTQRGEKGFALLLLVFSVTAFWHSYAISGFTGLSTAGVFPMLASATMTVAAVFILVQSLRLSPSAGHEAKTTPGFFESILPLRVVIMITLISAYVITMPLFGFLIASALFLLLSFSYLWRKPLFVSVLLTLVSLASVYFIFRKLFQVVLPKGTLLQSWF